MQRTIVGLRKDLGMTREEYAKAIGVKFNTLVRYEQMKTVPDVNVASKILKLSKLNNIDDVKWGN